MKTSPPTPFPRVIDYQLRWLQLHDPDLPPDTFAELLGTEYYETAQDVLDDLVKESPIIIAKLKGVMKFPVGGPMKVKALVLERLELPKRPPNTGMLERRNGKVIKYTRAGILKYCNYCAADSELVYLHRNADGSWQPYEAWGNGYAEDGEWILHHHR
jgi:hypothetical protein